MIINAQGPCYKLEQITHQGNIGCNRGLNVARTKQHKPRGRVARRGNRKNKLFFVEQHAVGSGLDSQLHPPMLLNSGSSILQHTDTFMQSWVYQEYGLHSTRSDSFPATSRSRISLREQNESERVERLEKWGLKQFLKGINFDASEAGDTSTGPIRNDAALAQLGPRVRHREALFLPQILRRFLAHKARKTLAHNHFFFAWTCQELLQKRSQAVFASPPKQGCSA